MAKSARADQAGSNASAVTRDTVTAGAVTAVTGKSAAERMGAYRARQAEAKKAAPKVATKTPPKASISERAKAKAPIDAKPARPRAFPTEGEDPAVAKVFENLPALSGKRVTYDPVYCDLIVPVAKLGISLTGFAGRIGVSYKTIKQWANLHEDFGAAVECAKAAMCYGLEVDAVTIRRKGGSPGQATMCMFQMKNLAGHEYADRKAIEIAGPDGGPIKHEKTVFNFRFIGRDKRVNLQGEIVDRVPLIIEHMPSPTPIPDAT